MKRNRVLILAVVTLLVPTAAIVVLYGFGVFDPVTLYRPVPPGHQEIVFLAPATSGESWERLVAAVDALYEESLQADSVRPKLHVNKDRAFVELTADVPEVGIWVDGGEDAKLWIRWYKLSGEVKTLDWVSLLTKRQTSPLAFIGGDVSYRGLKLAEALQDAREHKRWQGPAPLFLITATTVDRYIKHATPNNETTNPAFPLLIDVYKGRSFRFCFTNSRMASVLLDYVHTHEELWPNAPAPTIGTAAATTGAGDVFTTLSLLAAHDDLVTTQFYNLKWDDDSFSADLADRLRLEFEKKFPKSHLSSYQIEYSAGDFYQPNPREAFVVGQIMPELKADRQRRQLMLLPCSAERARRFLRTLLRRSAQPDWKNLVVMTGDSLNFNTIFRDRDVAWNIQDLPVPLVIFSHRNPVSEAVGFKAAPEGAAASAATGTEDLLLYRDILEAVLLTAFQGGQLTASADDLDARLKKLRWHNDRVLPPESNDSSTLLFNANGNRNDGTGEHIIVLRPDPDDRGVFAQATITVWRLDGDPGKFTSWRENRSLTVSYDTQSSDR
jgi:hypothetical protein